MIVRSSTDGEPVDRTWLGRRPTRRWLAGAAVAVAAIAAIGVAVPVIGSPRAAITHPAGPQPSRSLRPPHHPTPKSYGDFEDITIDLPPWRYATDYDADRGHPDCAAAGPVNFVKGMSVSSTTRYRARDLMQDKVTGDLAGITGEVRLVKLECGSLLDAENTPGRPKNESAVLATTSGPDGTLHGIGYLTSGLHVNVVNVLFERGDVALDLRLVAQPFQEQRRTFHWTGDRFVQVAGLRDFQDHPTVRSISPVEWVYELPATSRPPGESESHPTASLRAFFDALAAGGCRASGSQSIEIGLHAGRGIEHASNGDTDCTTTARLLESTHGQITGPGQVILATVRFQFRDAWAIEAYAFFDLPPSVEGEHTQLEIQPLETELRVVGLESQRITEDTLETVVQTSTGPHTYRWQWDADDREFIPVAQ